MNDPQASPSNYERLSREERAAIDAFILPSAQRMQGNPALTEQDIAARRENYAIAYLEHRDFVYDMICAELDARASYKHSTETGQVQEDYRIIPQKTRAKFEQYFVASKGSDGAPSERVFRGILSKHLSAPFVGPSGYQALIEAQEKHFIEPERLR
jgi:hypothetical protein